MRTDELRRRARRRAEELGTEAVGRRLRAALAGEGSAGADEAGPSEPALELLGCFAGPPVAGRRELTIAARGATRGTLAVVDGEPVVTRYVTSRHLLATVAVRTRRPAARLHLTDGERTSAALRLPPAGGVTGTAADLVRVAAVETAGGGDGFVAGLDLPAAGILHRRAARLAGWAVGLRRPVVAVEVEGERLVTRRARLLLHRPDVLAAHPDAEAAAGGGFELTVDLGPLAPTTLTARLACGEGPTRPWATLRLEGLPG